ncbi:MAG: ATP-binding protein [Bdellovibrionales bacterium]|nr:ATP-binding protein [Bdellovibrionales bacterium]
METGTGQEGNVIRPDGVRQGLTRQGNAEKALQIFRDAVHENEPIRATREVQETVTEELVKAAAEAEVKDKHIRRLATIPVPELSALAHVVAYERVVDRLADRADRILHGRKYSERELTLIDRLPIDLMKAVDTTHRKLIALSKPDRCLYEGPVQENFKLRLEELVHRTHNFANRFIATALQFQDERDNPKQRAQLIEDGQMRLPLSGRLIRYAVQALGIGGGNSLEKMAEKSFEEALARFPEAATKKVKLEVNPKKLRGHVPENYNVTFQILTELITNAVRATVEQGKGGKIEVNCGYDVRGQTILVKNPGIIAKEKLEWIFGKGNSTKPDLVLADGSATSSKGYGLYNCRKLAESISNEGDPGSLTVSVNERDGFTTFTLRLPNREESNPEAPLTVRQCKTLFGTNPTLKRTLLSISRGVTHLAPPSDDSPIEVE